MEVNGLICAGKKIHEILLDAGNMGMREMAEKYIRECQLMQGWGKHKNDGEAMSAISTVDVR